MFEREWNSTASSIQGTKFIVSMNFKTVAGKGVKGHYIVDAFWEGGGGKG